MMFVHFGSDNIMLKYTRFVQLRQEQSGTADVRHRKCDLDPRSTRIRIRTLDPDYFLNLTDFLIQGYICDKIVMKIRSLSPEMPNCGKNILSRNFEESLKKFLDPDPKAGDFQYLISSLSSLSTDRSVLKCW